MFTDFLFILSLSLTHSILFISGWFLNIVKKTQIQMKSVWRWWWLPQRRSILFIPLLAINQLQQWNFSSTEHFDLLHHIFSIKRAINLWLLFYSSIFNLFLCCFELRVMKKTQQNEMKMCFTKWMMCQCLSGILRAFNVFFFHHINFIFPQSLTHLVTHLVFNIKFHTTSKVCKA